ncbi:MAG TPA: hypothetical protein VE398_11005 [Acidobacteriota bacterium]|nr:hypothetical protein [Acidobacteriota bacterium]
MGRGHNQHPFDIKASPELREKKSGLDGFTEPDFVGNEQPMLRCFQDSRNFKTGLN